MTARPMSHAVPRSCRGVSLIELMVAMVIGLVILAGTLVVYEKARDIYSANDQLARLQENARYAMNIIESDVRMANYWGLMSRSSFVENGSCSSSPSGITVSNSCGTQVACPSGIVNAEWVFDVDRYIAGLNDITSNNALKSATTTLSCKDASDGTSGTTVAGTDVLIVRRTGADVLTGSPAANTAYLATTRTSGTIFTGTVPTAYSSLGVTTPPRYEVRPFQTSVYYVSSNSTGSSGFPALRRKRLAAGSGSPQLLDQEMLPGIDDLQVLFGWDTIGADTRADVYLPPEIEPASGAIVSVQICMVARSEALDLSMNNSNYVDCKGNTVASDNHRRLLFSRTVQLRNLRR